MDFVRSYQGAALGAVEAVAGLALAGLEAVAVDEEDRLDSTATNTSTSACLFYSNFTTLNHNQLNIFYTLCNSISIQFFYIPIT